MVVGCGAAFHLAKLCKNFFPRTLIGKVSRRFVELVVPLVARALVLIPPVAPLLLVAAMELRVPRFVPCLCGTAWWRDEAVVEDDAAAGVFCRAWLRGWRGCRGFSGPRPARSAGSSDDAGVRAVGFDHLDALGEHEALGEFVGLSGGFLHHDGVSIGRVRRWAVCRWPSCRRRVPCSEEGQGDRAHEAPLPWRGCGES